MALARAPELTAAHNTLSITSHAQMKSHKIVTALTLFSLLYAPQAAFTCPPGSTDPTSGSAAVNADCVVAPGYYIDGTDLNTPVLCTTNNYCPGTGAVGTLSAVVAASSTAATAGIAGCPTGSTLVAAQAGTAATANNDITDCVVAAGYYITGAPVPGR